MLHIEGLNKLQDRENCVLQSMASQRVGHDIVTEQQQNDEKKASTDQFILDNFLQRNKKL